MAMVGLVVMVLVGFGSSWTYRWSYLLVVCQILLQEKSWSYQETTNH
jgi:hypothetical protein